MNKIVYMFFEEDSWRCQCPFCRTINTGTKNPLSFMTTCEHFIDADIVCCRAEFNQEGYPKTHWCIICGEPFLFKDGLYLDEGTIVCMDCGWQWWEAKDNLDAIKI